MKIAFSQFRSAFVLLFFISYNTSFAQFNLVPNSSFEIFDTCPNNLNQLRYALPWTNPIYPGSTPDFYNACDTLNQFASVPYNWAGYEFARTGSGYAFIATASHTAPNFGNYREYIQVKLDDSLKAGVNYCIRFFVSAGDSLEYTCNNIGVYFSEIEIDTFITTYPFNLPNIPQFENSSSNNLSSRIGWTEISGNYIANGSEQYIIIGNFRDSNTTVDQYTGWSHKHNAGYFIDDVLITFCDSLSSVSENSISTNSEIKIKLYDKIIQIESNAEIIDKVVLTSLTGQIIFANDQILKKSFSIPFSLVAKGIYSVSVFTNKNYYMKKVIIY